MSVHVRREIIFDGTFRGVTGREIISRQKQRNIQMLDLDSCIKLFESGDPILDQWKEKVNGNTVFIFCINDTFPTPHFDDGDQSVRYFCWIETFQKWYSTHWRVSDTWNVAGAILVK
jgi:hypothetical protein